MPTDPKSRFTVKGFEALDALCESDSLDKQQRAFYCLFRDEMLSVKEYSDRLDIPVGDIRRMQKELDQKMPRGWKKKKPKSVRLSEQEESFVEEAAALQGVSISEFMRTAVAQAATDCIQGNANEAAIHKLSKAVAAQMMKPTMTKDVLDHGTGEFRSSHGVEVHALNAGHRADPDCIYASPLSKEVIMSMRLALEYSPKCFAIELRERLRDKENPEQGFVFEPLNEA